MRVKRSRSELAKASAGEVSGTGLPPQHVARGLEHVPRHGFVRLRQLAKPAKLIHHVLDGGDDAVARPVLIPGERRDQPLAPVLPNERVVHGPSFRVGTLPRHLRTSLQNGSRVRKARLGPTFRADATHGQALDVATAATVLHRTVDSGINADSDYRESRIPQRRVDAADPTASRTHAPEASLRRGSRGECPLGAHRLRLGVLDIATKLRPWALLRSLRVRAAERRRAAREKPVGRAKIGSPYDEIDDEFHAAYERARLDTEHDVPVLVVLADELVLFQGRARKSWSFSPQAYHLIKTVSHCPLAIFSSLQPGRVQPRVEGAKAWQESMQRWIDEARARLEEQSTDLDPDVITDLHTVLTMSGVLIEQPPEQLSREAVLAFAAELGPVLLRLIDAATQLQLDALHAYVEEAVAELSSEVRKRLEVVVTGNHQARVRSLPMQYFKQRLQEPANMEVRVTYAESVDNERDALALVGTRRIDRALAEAFFQDPSRMQRDLLGDAAKARLTKANLAPLS